MTVDTQWLGSYDKICSNCAGKRFLKQGEEWNDKDGQAFGSTFEENYEYFLIQKIKKLKKEMERRGSSRKKSFELSGKNGSKDNSELDSFGTSKANSRDLR
jgi:phage protein U